MSTPINRVATAILASLCLCTGFDARAMEKLPPCVPDKPVPPGGCLAPKSPDSSPLDRLRPAPPLKVPPEGQLHPAPPLAVPPPAASPESPPSVVKPPPTGDSEILNRPPKSDPNMPVLKPPKNPRPRT